MSDVKVVHVMYALVFKMLLKEPQSLDALEEETGLSRSTLYRMFKTLRKHKVVHISDWEQDTRGRDAIAVYKLGAGRDKSKYKISGAERTRRYRERLKQRKQTEELGKLITKGVSNAKRTDPQACAV